MKPAPQLREDGPGKAKMGYVEKQTFRTFNHQEQNIATKQRTS